MTIISGTSARERFSLEGSFVWSGSAWRQTSRSGTSDLNDLVRAGNGNDEVDGGGGNDLLNGEGGSDLLIGGAGNDAISGGDGNDTIFGGSARANSGGSGGDDLRGGNGNDTIYAGDANDILDGGAGADRLFGEEGDDVLNASTGRDVLVGGLGADQLTGGGDGDFYTYYSAADSRANLTTHAFDVATGDVINGFTSAAETSNTALQDKFDFRGLRSTATGDPLAWNGMTAAANSVWYGLSGSETFVNADTDGDGLADLVIKIGTPEILGAADFLL